MSSNSNSNFPNGFMDGVTIRGVPIIQTHPGSVFYVNNSGITSANPNGVGGADGNPGTISQPLSTIDAAINKTVANRGDVIFVMPGHAETLSTATTIELDVAGIAIVGIGGGSLRPTLTLDTAATSTLAVTANNISIKNIVFSAAFADITACFTLTTASNFHTEDCEFNAAAVNQNFLNIVDTSTVDLDASGLSMLRNKWIEPDTATLSWLKIDGDLACLSVDGCYSNLGLNVAAPSLAAVATGKDVTDVEIVNNTFIRLNTSNPLLLTADTTTANSGTVENNFFRHADIASELLVTTGTNIGFFDNKAAALVDTSGFLLPAADS